MNHCKRNREGKTEILGREYPLKQWKKKKNKKPNKKLN